MSHDGTRRGPVWTPALPTHKHIQQRETVIAAERRSLNSAMPQFFHVPVAAT